MSISRFFDFWVLKNMSWTWILLAAFKKVVYLYDDLKDDYEKQGFSDKSEEILTNYENAFNLFELEFEI